MKKWQKIALSGVAAVLIALLVYAIHKAGLACANVNKRAALKIVEANGCIEFWANRYQALVAAFIGAGVAFFVVRPVFRQLKAMNMQNAFQQSLAVSAAVNLFVAERETVASLYSKYCDMSAALSRFLQAPDDAPNAFFDTIPMPFPETNNFAELARKLLADERQLKTLNERRRLTLDAVKAFLENRERLKLHQGVPIVRLEVGKEIAPYIADVEQLAASHRDTLDRMIAKGGAEARRLAAGGPVRTDVQEIFAE